MIKRLLRRFGRRTAPHFQSEQRVKGYLTINVLDEDGNLVQTTEGTNIWTLTGREYLSELVGMSAFSVIEEDRGLYRNDRIAYIGLGLGVQPKVATVSSLVRPVSWDEGTENTGFFLAQLDTPTFPTIDGNTAIQFSKTFDLEEISVPTQQDPTPSIDITEAGLFTDGDPADNFTVKAIATGIGDTGSFAPVAYKTFEPITKTTKYRMQVIWKVMFI